MRGNTTGGDLINDRLQCLTQNEMTMIHEASMDVLTHTGIRFNDQTTLDIFKEHGFRIDGRQVFITDKDVLRALEQTPSRFIVGARNPEKDVSIGEDAFVFLPTAGAPNVVTASGEQRPATFADYQTCCKLVQTSQQLDMAGFMMVQPNDLPPETAHLDMELANIIMCDKPFMSAATSGKAVMDCIEMAGIIQGGKDRLEQRPVMVTVANPTTPLQYSLEQTTTIIEMARCRQPVAITNLVLAGTTGPVSLPALMVLQNAEILGGLVLAQLVNPGTPVIYGATSAPMDMKTGISAMGASETVVLASATIQLARFYHLPCRTGGMLTDSHYPDAQALAEATLLMSTAVRNGANFIVHACGQMGSFISMSFEKWLIDEEICGTIRRMLAPMEISAESLDVDSIKSIGSGGNYLLSASTFNHFKTLSQAGMFNRKDYQKWYEGGAERVDQVAAKALADRILAYRKPPIDQGLEEALNEYVDKRKGD